MAASTLTTSVIRSFDDPALNSGRWNRLLCRGETDVVFLTWTWQRVWWEVFGRGQLLLVVVERDENLIAIAPLFCDCGMVFFVGSGGSDYLDFIGDTSDDSVLEAILRTARSEANGFLGFRFYHVPDHSQTINRLPRVAAALGLEPFDEGSLAAPMIAMQDPSCALAAATPS